MEAGGRLQTVCGFFCGLDWRPTVFEDALPNAVCSACGLVCPMSGLLPCRHVLCHRCYSQCVDEASCRCPVDARSHRNEDVTWTSLTTEILFRHRIRCWNARNGCSTVGPASDIIVHFNSLCQHHVVTCQRCHRTVPQKGVIDHLVSRYCCQEPPLASPTLEGVGATHLLQSLQSFDKKLTESTRLSLDAIKEIHKKQISLERDITAVRQFSREEIDILLGQLESRMANMCSENTAKVLTASWSIETLTTALRAASVNDKNDVRKAWEELLETINKRSGTDELLHVIKELVEKFTSVMAASKAIIEILSSSDSLRWTINGWSKMKDAKNRGEAAISWAENPGFFYGYSILPGAEIANIEGTLSLHLVFQICKGLYDQLLSWPFQKAIHFKVLHPNGRDCVVCEIPITKDSEHEALQMPSTAQRPVLIAGNGIPIQSLETNGYNLNDEIRIMFEVMP
ncbi:hypothetical protein HPB48_018273 [Haemaphysalis longicornis]|uniref:TRAF1-6 MATH domain-containing protein n=1 Tax=Haemaphysalis longicornis TaxID=44386 RepID=A0A9J6FNM5_HAELO|nr:hypothetical protein HPB48_018273 [Haemaphysalis longicornis]